MDSTGKPASRQSSNGTFSPLNSTPEGALRLRDSGPAGSGFLPVVLRVATTMMVCAVPVWGSEYIDHHHNDSGFGTGLASETIGFGRGGISAEHCFDGFDTARGTLRKVVAHSFFGVAIYAPAQVTVTNDQLLLIEHEEWFPGEEDGEDWSDTWSEWSMVDGVAFDVTQVVDMTVTLHGSADPLWQIIDPVYEGTTLDAFGQQYLATTPHLDWGQSVLLTAADLPMGGLPCPDSAEWTSHLSHFTKPVDITASGFVGLKAFPPDQVPGINGYHDVLDGEATVSGQYATGANMAIEYYYEPVPEPGMFMLLGWGGLALWRRGRS